MGQLYSAMRDANVIIRTVDSPACLSLQQLHRRLARLCTELTRTLQHPPGVGFLDAYLRAVDPVLAEASALRSRRFSVARPLPPDPLRTLDPELSRGQPHLDRLPDREQLTAVGSAAHRRRPGQMTQVDEWCPAACRRTGRTCATTLEGSSPRARVGSLGRRRAPTAPCCCADGPAAPEGGRCRRHRPGSRRSSRGPEGESSHRPGPPLPSCGGHRARNE